MTLRKSKNITQQELANKLGVTNKAVSRWETGEGYPDITLIPLLAETLDVTTDELLSAQKKPTKKEILKHGNGIKFSAFTLIACLIIIFSMIIGIKMVYDNTFLDGIIVVLFGIILGLIIFLYGKHKFIIASTYTTNDRKTVFFATLVLIVSLATLVIFYYPLLFLNKDFFVNVHQANMYYFYLIITILPTTIAITTLIVSTYYQSFFKTKSLVLNIISLALGVIALVLVYLCRFIIRDDLFKSFYELQIAIKIPLVILSSLLVAYIVYTFLYKKKYQNNKTKSIVLAISITIIITLAVLEMIVFNIF